MNFAALEESLHDAIWLASAPGSEMKVINVLTAGLSFRTLVDKFGAVCMEATDLRVPKEDVAAFCGRLNDLGQRRNEYIHSAWQFRDPNKDPIRFKRTARPKAGFSLNVAPSPVADILQLADDILEAEHKVWAITP